MPVKFDEVRFDDSAVLSIFSDDLSPDQLLSAWERIKKYMSKELKMEFSSQDLMLDDPSKLSFTLKDFNLITYDIKKENLQSYIELLRIDSEEDLQKKEVLQEKKLNTNIRNLVLRLMLEKKKNEASELLVKELKRRNRFYAVRDDDRKELWIYSEGVYVPNGATYVQEFCRGILEEIYTTNFSNLLIDKIRADSFIDPDEFFKNNNKEEVAVTNGILNIYTKKLHGFTPDKVFFQKIPVRFDKTKDCPNIKKFIADITEDDSDCLVVQELFGDLLHKEYKFERCFMWLGDGRNGKSKLAELMKRFIGVKSCCSVHPSALEDPESFSIGNFFGKLANISLDINSTALRNISMIKSLSGRDLISAPRKFKTPIEFENYAKLIFGANQLPMTFDTKDSFWERWILLQFPYTFVSQARLDKVPENLKAKYKLRDNDIVSKITTDEEMSGLLNYALAGFERLTTNGNFSYKYLPEEVKTLWIMKSDSFSAFFLTYLEHDYDGKVRKIDLRKYYADFCRKNKLRPVSDVRIKRKMQDEGVIDDEHRHGTISESFWYGVKLKPKYEEVDEYNYSQMKEFESQAKLAFTKKLIEEEVM